MESDPAPAEEEAPAAELQESEKEVQQHAADTKDEEEPMEQEVSEPVIQEEAAETVSQVRLFL